MLFILLLNSFLIFIVHVFILLIYYVISLVCYFLLFIYFFFFFQKLRYMRIKYPSVREYRNRQQQPGYAADMRRLIWDFVVRTRKKNHFVTTWQIHKYYLPLSCLGSFMYAIECSVRFASCIRYTNKSIIYVLLLLLFLHCHFLLQSASSADKSKEFRL